MEQRMTDRRDFIRITAGTAGALGLYASGLGAATPAMCESPEPLVATRPMRAHRLLPSVLST